jgi:oligopeptide transport system permease protein
MAVYIARRVLWLGPALLFISLVTFMLMHAVPGGPWSDERKLDPAVEANLDRKYGLDKPVLQQYAMYVEHAVQGDLGISYARQDKPVTQIILSGFRVTAVLGLLSLMLATVAGVSLGVFAAVNRNRWGDYLSVAFASVGSAVPAFVLGVFFIYIFGVRLHWLSVFGWDVKHGLVVGWLPPLKQLILPVVTLAALPSAYLARITRASMLDVLNQDYMRTARAKGLDGRSILFHHAIKNAAIPILTVIGPIAAALVTGSFVIEQLFSVPGTGQLFVKSVLARDYGMIMGTTLFYAVIIVTANLAIDVTYAVADPRVRYQ